MVNPKHNGLLISSFWLLEPEESVSIEISRERLKKGWFGRYCNGIQLSMIHGIGVVRWKITDGSGCLNKNGKWEYEPLPSGRTDAFLARCRYSTIEEALTIWETVKHIVEK
jgi:hypothetical protein